MNAVRESLARFLQGLSIRWEMNEKYHLAAQIGYYSYRISETNLNELLKFATLEMKAEKYASAIQFLEKYLEEDKDSTKALLLLGIAYRQNGAYQQAIKTHLKCLKKGEEDPNTLYTLGLDYEKAKKTRTAKRYYSKVIETEKAFSKAYYRLAHLYMVEKKYDLAVNLYLDGLSLKEGTAKDWINLSLCYLMTSNYKAAEKVLVEALELFPQSSEVLFALGTCYIKSRNYKKSDIIISKLGERDESNLTLSLKVREALDKKNYEQLEILLDQFNKNERNAEYWYMKSIVEANTKNEKKAVESLKKALTMDSELRKEALKDDNFALIREFVEFKNIVYPRK